MENTKLTQHELILAYIKDNGSFTPAKMVGKIYLGQMYGSESGKRCRELRKQGKLWSKKEGKFEVFYLIREATKMVQEVVDNTPLHEDQMKLL